jgi:hypothetical protein
MKIREQGFFNYVMVCDHLRPTLASHPAQLYGVRANRAPSRLPTTFLALQLAKELEDRLHRRAVAAEWADILRDLDRLQEIQLEQDGKRFLLRTPTTGVAGKLFQAVGVAVPPNIHELPRPAPHATA